MNEPYVLLLAPSGKLLAAHDGIDEAPLATDATCWRKDQDGFESATCDIRIEPGEIRRRNITPVAGPTKLPSAHLAELRQNGYTILENILGAAAIERLRKQIADNRKAKHADEADRDGHFWMMDGLAWAPDFVKASVHPLALWLLRTYMSTDDIHFCHQPIITTLRPADALKGTFPEAGWHSDYPYHPGVFPDDHWPESPVFGVQYNVCLDEFRADNAATQFVPGSHRLCKGPPVEFNRGGTRMGEGIHKDVSQFYAPAGAGLIYDARTWHRACHELNVSGKDRIAFLNAVAPAWVRPMIDKTPVGDRYATSEVPGQLTEREREDVERLCNSPTLATPEGMPKLLERRRRRSPTPKIGASHHE